MTPTEAPEAPIVAAAAPSEAPAAPDDAASAAAPSIDPEIKKLRDRLAEEGRKRREHEQLALQQAAQIADLNNKLGQVSQFMSQQQTEQMRSRLAQMTPEEQLAFLTEKVLAPQPTAQPVQQAPQPTPEVQAIQQRVQMHLAEANDGLSEPITGYEPELQGHKDEVSWVKALTRLRAAREKEESVPTAKTQPKKDETPLTPANVQRLIDEAVAKATGVQRPNAAAPAGASTGGASIADLNKIVNDPNLGPRAKEAALRKLQAGS